MHEVARKRAAFNKSKPGSLELVNPLVSTPGRGFTGIYIYIYIFIYIYIERERERERDIIYTYIYIERERERERERKRDAWIS